MLRHSTHDHPNLTMKDSFNKVLSLVQFNTWEFGIHTRNFEFGRL